MKKLRLLSLCSGIGGADLAAEWTGAIEVVGQVEINTFCQQVLASHWPHVKRMSDIREVQGDEFGTVNIVVGGIPCQPFSNAGKQNGTDDDRYLWPDMFRIVRQSHAAWVVVENVDDFTYLALDLVQADLESEDYTVQAYVLPACAIGAPHERQRCFVVAYSSLNRESRKESAVTPGECNALESTSVCEDVADAHGQRQQERNPSIRGSDSRLATRCLDTSVADANSARGPLQTSRRFSTEQVSQRGAPRKSQSSMGGVLDGISARLDSVRWPSLPSQAQYEWEPPRTIRGKSPGRNKRLEALGNAIVPYQIFPIFQGIVVWEMGKEKASCERVLP